MALKKLTTNILLFTTLTLLLGCKDKGATIIPTNEASTARTQIVASNSNQSTLINVTTPTSNPCKNIREACKNAGFIVGGKQQGKGIVKNCMEPILAGQQVSGVTVNANDIEMCKQKKAAKQNPSTTLSPSSSTQDSNDDN